MWMAPEMDQRVRRIGKRALTRNRFSAEENQTFRELVDRFGTDKLDNIVSAMGNTRTKRQLRERWQAYLSHDIVLTYTEEDDQ
jgi:hypothetical protein